MLADSYYCSYFLIAALQARGVDVLFEQHGARHTDFRTGEQLGARDHVVQCPKHASWLNMVEIEIGVLRTTCLDRRIEQRAELESEIATWERRRNASREKIQWMFDCEKARRKMRHAYPQITPQPNAVPVAA